MSLAPPAKRPEAHQFPTPDAKRPKMDDDYLDDDELDSLFAVDSPTGEQDDSFRRKYIPDYDFESGLSYCQICGGMVDHILLTCPDKAKGSGIYCFVCEGPCKSSNDEHHIKNHKEIIMHCSICGCQAKHWSDNCPYRDENDDASDPENHLVSTESAQVSSCFYD